MRRSWETDSRNCRSRARDRSRDTAIWLIERPSSVSSSEPLCSGTRALRSPAAMRAVAACAAASGRVIRRPSAAAAATPRPSVTIAARTSQRRTGASSERDVLGEDDGGDVPATAATAAAAVAAGRAGRQALGRPHDALVGAVQDGAGAERGGVEVRGQAGNRVEAGGRGDRAVGRHEHAGGVAQLQRPAQHQDRAALRVAANAGAVRRPLPQRLEPAGQLLERGRIEVQLVELADEAVLGRRGGPNLGDDDGDEAGDHQRGRHDGDHDRRDAPGHRPVIGCSPTAGDGGPAPDESGLIPSSR